MKSSILVLLALAGVGSAQELAPGPRGLAALAPTWTAELGADGVAFRARLGADAPRTLGLELSFLGASVGGTELPAALDVAPFRRDGLAVYDRGALLERYEPRDAGLYQSFVLLEEPALDGDLVVRLGVESELVAGGGEGSLTLVDPTVGALTIGEVLGVAADGERCAGTSRWTDGGLELTLPAAFVRDATYPLVLDPLLGVSTTFGDPASSNEGPDVAYDLTSDSYFVAWSVVLSATASNVWCQRLDASGATVPGTLELLQGGIDATNDEVRVATGNGADQGFVVWTRDTQVAPSQVFVVCYDVPSGAHSLPTPAESSSNAQHSPDVGGIRTAFGTLANLVFVEDGVGVRGRRWQCLPGGVPVPQSATTLRAEVAGVTLSAPTISSSNGNLDSFYVVWIEEDAANGARLIGAPYGSSFSIVGTPRPHFVGWGDVHDARVDGTGNDWVLVAEVDGAGNRDVVARHVSQVGPIYTQDPVFVVAGAPSDETAPRVAWNGVTAAVSYRVGGSLFGRSVDTVGDGACEAPQVLSTAAPRNGGVASTYGGGADELDGRALFVWHEEAAANHALGARVYAAPVGPVDLGGTCDTGGTLRAACTVDGYASFAPELTGTWANRPSFLLTSLHVGPVPCGTCTLHPVLDQTHFVVAGLSSPNGTFQPVVPIPSGLVGTTAYLQCVTVLPGTFGSCPLLGGKLCLSNALAVTIQP